MNPLFVDTSGWGNLLDRSQPYHTLTSNLYRFARHQGQPIITTNYVLSELVALLTSPLRLPRSTIISFIQGLKDSPYVQIHHIDFKADTDAWNLLCNRSDKDWSLVDCSSFIVMQQLKCVQALTNDRHFEQAGFIRLLK